MSILDPKQDIEALKPLLDEITDRFTKALTQALTEAFNGYTITSSVLITKKD